MNSAPNACRWSSRPIFPTLRTGRNRPLMIGGAAVAGLVLDCFWRWHSSCCCGRCVSTDQVEALGYPLLGAVPLLHSDRPKKRFGIFRRRETGFA